ncbi:MAG: FIG060329: MOSC domain protein [uncultured Thiotrichaceae bacterium]|uniref:FIG060329: MOSC domain protein n=1 Tax=uncultured Thiotrichaceae bacterium TaxID=298394 RepID=A0A6S6SI98_9GAMM|nr:MAG: FIG060329: MOSC domain protein [uncultured Thiotrichaceae bacterium]
MPTVTELLETLPQRGRVDWIGLRPERRATMNVVNEVEAVTNSGLLGDRYAGTSGKRQVTLVQTEHLPVIASLLGRGTVKPELLRRNICVSSLNLLALKDKTFQIGDAVLEYTGLCHPCSFMETTFGEGGYNAVRGHGGITARVIRSGKIRLRDEVFVMTNE